MRVRRTGHEFVLVVLFALSSVAFASRSPAEGRPFRIATTTSLERSGLLGALLPAFANESGRSIRVLGRGTAEALALGRRGEVDVVLSPASPEEAALVESGVAFSRKRVLETRFVIAGPPADPAGVARAKSPERAIAQIFRLRAPFVRRADDSDVRAEERRLFALAGLDPELRWEAVVETTAGMRDALERAGRAQAYVVVDLAAFLPERERTGLVALSKPSPALVQVYSLLRLDADRVGAPLDDEGGFLFEQFLLSPKAQRLIRDFRIAGAGEAPFRPLALDESGTGRGGVNP
ncbi:MAG: substrate-binding domain-containing protein [Myxococcota bacterium]